MMWIHQVHIDPSDVQKARDYSDKILGLDKIKNTPNYTGLENPDRFFIGELGEIALAIWFDKHGVEYQRLRNDKGVSDIGDFLVGMNYIDVKNSAHPRSEYLMMPEDQFLFHTRQIYIGCWTQLLDDCALVSLCGWITRENFKNHAQVVDMKVKTMRFPFNKLVSMEYMI